MGQREGRLTEMLSREYLAGVLDGEGYLGIMQGNAQQRMKYIPTIKMTNTHEGLVRLFARQLGGHVSSRPFADHMEWKPAWCWAVRGYVAVTRVLDVVQPFLIVKQQQAEVLRAFLETVTPSEGPRGVWKLPESILRERGRLYLLMKELNRKGRSPAETERERPVDLTGEVTVRPARQRAETGGNVLSPSNN